ncbi:MAG: YciI-like protein, partial [Cyclobacteriaceae bacterium]
MYYILTYITSEDYVERRTPFRSEHLSLAQEFHDKGYLLLGGALTAPADKAIIIFTCDDEKVVEDFIHKDPYVQNGLITSWEIREWTVVVGKV